MSISGIQGQPLEITVAGCTKLKDTEWIARQDPYVCIEYGSTKFRTRTCTDGGKNPSFQEKFTITLIEGLREINVIVWNKNTLTYDDFIGNGKIQLHKVLSNGYDDSSWPLQDKRGRHAGEVKLIMHYSSATNKPTKTHAPSAPPYPGMQAPPQAPLYSAPPPAAMFPSKSIPEPALYPPQNIQEPAPYHSYPPNPAGYPPPPYNESAAAYPPIYPPGPSPSTYPPAPQNPHYHPPGLYPPPPYPPPY